MKIRGVMARKGDTPKYVNKMQQEVFEVLGEARKPAGSERDRAKSPACLQEVLGRDGWCRRYGAGYPSQVSKLNYSRRCAILAITEGYWRRLGKRRLLFSDGLETT